MDNGLLEETKADVRERYPDVPWVDVYTDPIWRGRSPNTKEKVEGRHAVVGVPVDSDEERVYCVASEQYQIVRPEVAVSQFEQALSGFDEYGKPTITIQVFGGGAKWFVEALFPTKVKINGREISPKAGQKNSLDLGWEYSNWFGAYDWMCSNGMVSGHLEVLSKKKHRLNLDVINQTKKLTEGMHKMSDQFLIWEGWARKKLDQAGAEGFLEALPISDRQVEKIRELPEVGTNLTMGNLLRDNTLTVLGLHGLVTQYFTHEVEQSVSRLNREDKIATVFHRLAQKAA